MYKVNVYLIYTLQIIVNKLNDEKSKIKWPNFEGKNFFPPLGHSVYTLLCPLFVDLLKK